MQGWQEVDMNVDNIVNWLKYFESEHCVGMSEEDKGEVMASAFFSDMGMNMREVRKVLENLSESEESKDKYLKHQSDIRILECCRDTLYTCSLSIYKREIEEKMRESKKNLPIKR